MTSKKVDAHLSLSILPKGSTWSTHWSAIEVYEDRAKDFLPSFPFLKVRDNVAANVMTTMKHLHMHTDPFKSSRILY